MGDGKAIIEFTLEVEENDRMDEILAILVAAIGIGAAPFAERRIDVDIAIFENGMGLLLEIGGESFQRIEEKLFRFFVGVLLRRVSELKEAVVGTMLFQP